MYQRYLRLLKNWPVDKSKSGRDFGEFLRKQTGVFADTAAVTHETALTLTTQLESLERLADNVYAAEYRRLLTSTATGLSGEQCSQVLSSEFLRYLNDDDDAADAAVIEPRDNLLDSDKPKEVRPKIEKQLEI